MLRESGEPQKVSLEEYLQKIEQGKNDPVIVNIVALQGEYVDKRVELTNEQGEQIKQLAIEMIKKLSQLDLDKLIREPYLIASMYEKDKDVGLGDSESITQETGDRYKGNLFVGQEATCKMILLAFATMEFMDLQEKFLTEYLDNKSGLMGKDHIIPKELDIAYVIHEENGNVSSKKSFEGANPALVKFPEMYKQAWERARKLIDSSYEFKKIIVNPENEDSPLRSKASEIGSFYGTWGNGVQYYFRENQNGTMNVPRGREDKAPFCYAESFGPEPIYLYSVREIDENGVVHFDQKRVERK